MENNGGESVIAEKEQTKSKIISGFASGIGKAAAGAKMAAEKAQDAISNAIDVNGDGKIDVEDFNRLAGDAEASIRRGKEYLGKVAADVRSAADFKQLRPVFPADLLPLTAAPGTVSPLQIITRPGMIRIVDRDKKREESEVCTGAVGYWTLVRGMDILNIYEDRARDVGIQFYPNIGKTFYYADPCQSNFYISLDEYFQYMKKARVSELETVAKDLGARKFSIVFKEQKKTFVSKAAKVSGRVGVEKSEASYSGQNSEITNVSIASQSEFSGHTEPVQPRLVYFRNESDIEKLIGMRMDATQGNQIKSKTYSLQYNRTSGIKEAEAASIDAVLSQLKCSGTASISSEAQDESRVILEYTIEF